MIVEIFPGFQELKIPEKYPCCIKDVKATEFTRLRGSIYVDHAAATLYSEYQLRDIFSSLSVNIFGNPHSRHVPSDTTTEAVEFIRNRVLSHFNTSQDEYELIFTSGATEAIKLVANSFLWGGSKHRGNFVYTQENHTSVIGIRELVDKKYVNIYCIPVNSVEKTLKSKNSVNTDTNFEQDFHENSLFIYPAQCNFTGSKYPSSWIEKIQNGKLCLGEKYCINKSAHCNNGLKDEDYKKWFVLLDAAAFAATSPLDLSQVKPDFVPVSFYKIFGYPTGLGCLLVNKRAWGYLHKSYFGGGTVQIVDSSSMKHEFRKKLHEKFEDGTLPFLDILSLRYGFNTLLRITGGMKNVEEHVFNLSRYLIYNLRSMRHSNSKNVAEVYGNDGLLTLENHGSIVSFNLKDSEGNYVGYSHVERVSSLYNIYLRTGCFCNPGACQRNLSITSEELIKQFKAGHVCGDSNDLVEGHPTGSVRVSFGYISTYDDVDAILNMVKECFVEGSLIFDSNWYEDLVSKEKSCEGTSEIFENLEKKTSEIENVSSRKELFSIKDEIVHNDNQLSSHKPLVLTDIIVYPVKSCAGMLVTDWIVGSRGLNYDRNWMIVTCSGVTLTLKRNPRLSLIKPRIDESRNTLTLSYNGQESINIPLNQSEESTVTANICGGRVCGDKIKGKDCGEEVSEWLSAVLQIEGLRLVRQIEGRQSKLMKGSECNGILSLANESQFLAIHRPSIRLLIEQIKKKNLETSLEEDELKLRFRPNFVIDGGTAYEEDAWKSFEIGSRLFRVIGGCTRCQMICVNPCSGERSKEPMLTLGATRGPRMTFGVHAICDNIEDSCLESISRTLKVGMDVYSKR